jgi:hypothetical protein
MPKIGNSISPSDIPCDRCGSKRKVSKAWTEKIKSDHGVMILEHKEIICTNKVCQAEFEAVLKKENEKRAKIHQIKVDNDAKRARDKAARVASVNA